MRRKIRGNWAIGIVCYVVLITQVLAQQSFRIAPNDTSVIVGQTVLLKCVIDNIKGALQWSKDGLGLGFDRSIPGFPRYQVRGSTALGEYNLMISNVRLSDDAEYHCQVLPAPGNPPLIGIAYLNVYVPPEQPEIEGHQNGSRVEVPHTQETLNLTCTSLRGKPAAELKWFKNRQPITEGVTYIKEKINGDKRENAKSILTMKPQSNDNEALFSCQASNPATLNKPLVTTVELSVLYPPGKPKITGYRNGDVIKMGDTVKLTCVSSGGNPLASVHWYKNDKQLDFSYESGNNRAENELVFTVEPNDNDAVYRCDVSNRVTTEPLTAQVKLKVQFGPDKVTITGPQHPKAGETIVLSCETGISNPPAVITWSSGGQSISANKPVVKPSPKGGYITKSNITVTLTDRQNNVMYDCYGANKDLGKTQGTTITLRVMYPPDRPTISGYTKGKSVTAGQIQSMTCTAVGGNPPPSLTWWKGNTKLQSARRVMGSKVESQVSFILKAEDNGAEYRCNATNAATPAPLITSVRLAVNFPPKSVDMKQSPEDAQAGQPLSITCKSASSSPAAVITWWKDASQIHGINGGVEDCANGGKCTISKIELTPSAADDQEIYSCRATNTLLEMSVNDAVALNVRYKPVFPPEVPKTVEVIEGHASILNLTAMGNPSKMTYTWYKDGQKLDLKSRPKRDLKVPHFYVDGGVLNITNISRKDAGAYMCVASNAEGKGNMTVQVMVQYPAMIKHITKQELVDQGKKAFLECYADANPVVDNMISWTRPGYNMARAIQNQDVGKSYLTVYNVTKDDSGAFMCVAKNGIGDPAEAVAELIVKYQPEIDRTLAFGKAAADKGSTGKLTCKAEGAPEVTITWFKGGQELDISGTKYSTEFNQVNIVHYQSFLYVFNVTKADYGQYTCMAKNELGRDSRSVILDGTSKPDPPYDIHFINATHNSITMSWTPGFDGGSAQTFQVRYKQEKKTEGYNYQDVVPYGATIFTVTGLAFDTEYELTVRGVNRLGESVFAAKHVKGRTVARPQELSMEGRDDVPLIIILTVCIIGMILLGLNVLLILFFIRRRKKKFEKNASDSTSNGNTVEMFNAPTITEDSKSYTTYDRSLDDFEDPYKLEEEEEMRKAFLGPHYDGYNIKGSHPGLYPPSRSSLPPSREGIYYVEPPPSHQGSWDPQRGPYPTGPGSRSPPEEHHAYADRLRRVAGRRDEGNPKLEGRMSPAKQPPPPPPVRSSSRGVADSLTRPRQPPVPSRNYGPEEAPSRYRASPASDYGSNSRLPTSLPPQTPPEMRGHLV